MLSKCKTLLITCVFLIVGTVSAQTVDIPDLHLLLVIERAIGKSPGETITVADMELLTEFNAVDFSIRDLTGLEYATNLTRLDLRDNNITDITPLANLTRLEELYLGQERYNLFTRANQISNITPLANLTRLKILELRANQVGDITPLANLIQLEELRLGGNQIRDITALTNLTQLSLLCLWRNQIRDIIALTNLTQLTRLSLATNQIRDINPLTNLTQLVDLRLQSNEISDITPLANLTQLEELYLRSNQIRDISSLTNFTQLSELDLRSNQISDIAPLANLTQLEELDLAWNQISDISVIVNFGNLKELNLNQNPIQDATPLCALAEQHPTFLTDLHEVRCSPIAREFLLSVPAGINLIHVPLQVTTVDGMAQNITSIADLYDALGGASTVNFLITYDSQTQEWRSYFGASDTGAPADRVLTDDTGIIAGMIRPVAVLLGGNAFGVLPVDSGGDRKASITLNQGLNLVALPLRNSGITRVSDLFTLEGIGGNVPVIILTDNGEFKAVGRAGDPGDIEITGGQSFILTVQRPATIVISGSGWNNTN